MRLLNLSLLGIISTLLLSFGPLKAQAKDIVLFENGRFVSDYNDKIKRIQAGDRLHFSNGRSFQVKQILGLNSKHAMTFIVEIENERVVRLAQMRMDFSNQQQVNIEPEGFFDRLIPQSFRLNLDNGWQDKPQDIFLKYLMAYLKGYEALVDSNIPIVEVLVQESQLPEFIVVKKENVEFALKDLTQNLANFSEKEKKKLEKQFIQFALTTTEFERIGDFNPNQIIWNGKKWILLDFSDGHKKIDSDYSSEVTAFSDFPDLGSEINSWVLAAKNKIVESRQGQRAARCAALLEVATPTGNWPVD